MIFDQADFAHFKAADCDSRVVFVWRDFLYRLRFDCAKPFFSARIECQHGHFVFWRTDCDFYDCEQENEKWKVKTENFSSKQKISRSDSVDSVTKNLAICASGEIHRNLGKTKGDWYFRNLEKIGQNAENRTRRVGKVTNFQCRWKIFWWFKIIIFWLCEKSFFKSEFPHDSWI